MGEATPVHPYMEENEPGWKMRDLGSAPQKTGRSTLPSTPYGEAQVWWDPCEHAPGSGQCGWCVPYVSKALAETALEYEQERPRTDLAPLPYRSTDISVERGELWWPAFPELWERQAVVIDEVDERARTVDQRLYGVVRR